MHGIFEQLFLEQCGKKYLVRQIPVPLLAMPACSLIRPVIRHLRARDTHAVLLGAREHLSLGNTGRVHCPCRQFREGVPNLGCFVHGILLMLPPRRTCANAMYGTGSAVKAAFVQGVGVC